MLPNTPTITSHTMLNVENFPEVLCACIIFQSDWRAPLKVNIQFKVYKVKVDECYERRYILLQVLARLYRWRNSIRHCSLSVEPL